MANPEQRAERGRDGSGSRSLMGRLGRSGNGILGRRSAAPGRRLPRKPGPLPAALVIAVALVACGSPTPTGNHSPVPSPMAVATAEPTGAPSEDRWLSPKRLEQAHRFRRAHGLREDDAWIRSLAVDPDAAVGIPAFGIPMLASEVDLLRRRAISVDPVIEEIEAYGEPLTDVWGGAYVRPDVGTVVALFAGDLRVHEDALLGRLDPGSPFVLGSVAHPLRDLKELQTLIGRDSWISDQGYHLVSVGAMIPENIVRVRISSADPEAAASIVGHYGKPGMLRVESDGTGVASWPTGVIKGRVVDENGDGVADLDIELDADIVGAGPSEIGVSTRQDGTFDVETTATGYTLQVLSPFGPGGTFLEGPDRLLVATVRVVVPANETTEVEVVAEQ